MDEPLQAGVICLIWAFRRAPPPAGQAKARQCTTTGEGRPREGESAWRKGAQRQSRPSSIADDCVNAVTMALTRAVLLILYGPFEIATAEVKVMRSIWHATFRRQVGRNR